MIYLESFSIPTREQEEYYREIHTPKSCFSTMYPFHIFTRMDFSFLEFEPITILYGGNGTGKTTLLNIIAEKLKLNRNAVFNKSTFYDDYLSLCGFFAGTIPENSRIMTSDDVFDYILDIRNINEGIDKKREELFEEYDKYREKSSHFHYRTMDDYEDLKNILKVRSKSNSELVKKELGFNAREYSNGENAFTYFTDKIKENALYLLDEPENSLSPKRQLELKRYIEDSARFYKCQFIISTHSPFLLALAYAKIYNLDKTLVTTSTWTELDNVRTYFEFFEKHREEFI